MQNLLKNLWNHNMSIYVIFSCLSLLSSLPHESAAQTTDPREVGALDKVFQAWDTKATELWNISGNPCTGSALNDAIFENPDNNPAIVCECGYNNATTCHITKLRVYALNKRGVIPEELTSLTHLTFFKIDQNYFTGPLPSFIGNLSSLQLLSIAHNAFSGSIPKELGNLKQLTMLSFGSNNFSGTLPPELGNLVNLEQLYIDSSGVWGSIPSTFANLVNLRTVWASDIKLVGKIPDFIGNWKNLISLRVQGNGFEGPIPSTFANLTSLISLRISDIYNVSSSLDFIKAMEKLSDLVLRNALISGKIPSDIGSYRSLQKLDLSFNNLKGEIPIALFNLPTLNYLFLGNNSLSGTIPAQKSEKLQTIDLSYNQLSGSFPSWVNASLQLNLVANNFIFDRLNVSLLPGLNCLQRNFPCHRNTPQYVNFSLNCGGQGMRPPSGLITYESENSTLGPASYFVSDKQNWAVSITGLYADSSYSTYIQHNLAQAVNTDTPELFQTSRQSPGSLVYYGLGLVNGYYTVRLHFAETVFADRQTQTWLTLARRMFDIYIQGRLRQKDFDISKEAGGVERAIEKEFNVSVTENCIQINLFWAGLGTCCNPVQGYYGAIISGLTVFRQ